MYLYANNYNYHHSYNMVLCFWQKWQKSPCFVNFYKCMLHLLKHLHIWYHSKGHDPQNIMRMKSKSRPTGDKRDIKCQRMGSKNYEFHAKYILENTHGEVYLDFKRDNTNINIQNITFHLQIPLCHFCKTSRLSLVYVGSMWSRTLSWQACSKYKT